MIFAGGASKLLIGRPRTPVTELPGQCPAEAYLRTTPVFDRPGAALPAPPMRVAASPPPASGTGPVDQPQPEEVRMKCLLGFHSYTPISSRWLESFLPGDNLPSRHETQILLRCERCGKFRVRSVPGEWNLSFPNTNRSNAGASLPGADHQPQGDTASHDHH